MTELCSKADELLLVSTFCYPDFTEFADVIDSAGGVHNVVFNTTLKDPEVVGKIDALLSFGKEMNRIKVKW